MLEMHQSLSAYFRCPEEFAEISGPEKLSPDLGYFRFGPDVICYGRSASGFRCASVEESLYDTLPDARSARSSVEVPFDVDELVTNLRYERYANKPMGSRANAVRHAYYLARPLMPVPVRKWLQKARLKGWHDIAFPRWPVDTTVESLMERLLGLAIQRNGGESVPFIWFWPEGKSACAIMTHDVEERPGVEYCSRLMDINESFQVPASFQVVPEERYVVTERFLESIRKRGFEVCVHDLNHDGRLYWDLQEFKRRAAKINRYAKEWGARGFRAGILYRNQAWFEDLEVEFEMSVPNVAHLDPQRGGCCTVMPYFVGKILEMPVTAIQDYSLFNILNDYSTDLWERQIGAILAKHGLVSIITHPDYLMGHKREEVYKSLLAIYCKIRRDRNVWMPLPGEVNRWWRQRSQMRLVQQEGAWRVEGPGSERAVVAAASLEGDRMRYSLVNPSGAVIGEYSSEGVTVSAG
jgi:peptidoglycan/xylan/chitin deacetylase (PgdA/CDA1 family)